MRSCVPVMLVLLFWSDVLAQSPQRISLKGEVLASNPAGLLVEVQSAGGHGPPERTHVRADGSFEVRGLEAGDYNVRVTNMRGHTIQQEYVRLRALRGA